MKGGVALEAERERWAEALVFQLALKMGGHSQRVHAVLLEARKGQEEGTGSANSLMEAL